MMLFSSLVSKKGRPELLPLEGVSFELLSDWLEGLRAVISASREIVAVSGAPYTPLAV